MPVTDPFDTFSGLYDMWFETHAGLYENELAAVRRLMPEPGSRTIEIGAGTGRFALPLGIGLGVEPSAPMAGRALYEQGRTCCVRLVPDPGARKTSVLYP